MIKSYPIDIPYLYIITYIQQRQGAKIVEEKRNKLSGNQRHLQNGFTNKHRQRKQIAEEG